MQKGFSERRLVSSTGWESKKQGAGTQKEVKGTRILVEEVSGSAPNRRDDDSSQRTDDTEMTPARTPETKLGKVKYSYQNI